MIAKMIEPRWPDPDAVMRAWTIQLATDQGTPSRTDAVSLRRARPDRPIADGPSVPGFGAAASAARSAVEYRSTAWSLMVKMPAITIFRSCTGTRPSRWLPSTLRARLGWRRAHRIPRIQEFMARRIAALGTPESMASLGRRARSSAWISRAGIAVDRDRRVAPRSAAGRDAGRVAGRIQAARHRPRPSACDRGRSRWPCTFGDPAARAALRHALTDPAAPLAPRREAIQALLQVKDPTLAATLHGSGSRRRAGRARHPGTFGLRRPIDARCLDQVLSVVGCSRAS